MLYLSGISPGTIILVFILITFIAYSMVWFGFDIKYDIISSRMMKNRSVVDFVQFDEKLSTENERSGVILCGILLMNATILVTINGFYIYAYSNFDTNVVTLIQLLLAIFKSVWNGHVIYIMTNWVNRRNSLTSVIAMIVFNNIICPFLSFAFLSSSCFRDVFFEQEAVESTYTYIDGCDTGLYITGCLQFSYGENTVSYQPPYVYSYECEGKHMISKDMVRNH